MCVCVVCAREGNFVSGEYQLREEMTQKAKSDCSINKNLLNFLLNIIALKIGNLFNLLFYRYYFKINSFYKVVCIIYIYRLKWNLCPTWY